MSTFSFSHPLTVGVYISGPPISEKTKTSQGIYYYGFLIDLMDNICKRIEQKCTFQEITFQNEFDLLNEGKIDLLMMPQPYMSLDQTQYATSIPYSVSRIQFISLKGSSINEISDIINKKIGVDIYTFYYLLIESPYYKNNKIIAYHSASALLSDLERANLDVIVLNAALAHQLFIDVNNIKPVGKDVSLGNGYGIIGLSDKAELIDRINKAIISIEKDGTYNSLYQKYNTH